MYDATFTLQKRSSPGLSKRTFRRYFLSQDFILSIEMIIFGILMNLAFSWFDTSVSVPSKLENTFGCQELGPQKMGPCPCYHVEYSKASIFCQSFLCRREFSLAQGTPSQRGGFSHYHSLPLQFFHLVAGPTDLIDLDGSKDKGHIDCPKNLSIDWKEYSTFGKIESIRRWSLGVHRKNR